MSRFAKTRETLGVSIRSGAGNERLETNSAVLAHARALNSRGLSGKFDTDRSRSGVSARTGNGLDAVAVAWQHRWSGRL